MSLRTIGIAVFCLTSLASAVGVVHTCSQDPAPPPQAGSFEIPWVQSPQEMSASEAKSVPALRAIAADRQRSPEQRARAICLLAKADDWDGVGPLISLLDDPVPLVRGRAAAALRYMLGTDFCFRAGDDPTKRRAAIDGIRRYWESRKFRPPRSRSQP